MDPDLELALRLARGGGAIAQRHLRGGVAASTKVDGTVASRADAEVEAWLRAQLAAERPGDAVLGEELGAVGGRTGRRWVLDPVDGTAQFVRHHPTWAVQITLEQDGAAQVAVVHAPAHAATWWAMRGAGTHAEPGGRLGVSAVRDVAEATVAVPDVQRLARTPALEPVLALLQDARSGLGGESFWSYVHVAAGHADLGVVPIAYRWDWAPGALLVLEAGGAVALADLGLDGPAVLLANGDTLLDELVRRLGVDMTRIG